MTRRWWSIPTATWSKSLCHKSTGRRLLQAAPIDQASQPCHTGTSLHRHRRKPCAKLTLPSCRLPDLPPPSSALTELVLRRARSRAGLSLIFRASALRGWLCSRAPRAASNTGTPLIMIEFNFEVLRRIGFNQFTASQLAGLEPAAEGARLMRLTEVQRDWLTVHDGNAEYKARALPRLIAECTLSVGDWLVLENNSHNELWISQQLPPANHISRRSADGHRQSIASNIDTALLVMGLDQDFNLRRLERYIAMVQSAEISPVIVLTKADIAVDINEHLYDIRRRIPSHIPVTCINALSRDAINELAPWLGAGQTLCLLGSSGAGKSTLTNTLSASHQETGGIRKGDGRGRHTTTARSLHLCADGTCIIDTPGLRTWCPDADEETLASVFTDIELLASDCQFRDCRHESEPGCAVRGNIHADRLLNYHKLLRDAQRSQQTPLERIAEKAKWKVINKAGTARSRDKRN